MGSMSDAISCAPEATDLNQETRSPSDFERIPLFTRHLGIRKFYFPNSDLRHDIHFNNRSMSYSCNACLLSTAPSWHFSHHLSCLVAERLGPGVTRALFHLSTLEPGAGGKHPEHPAGQPAMW